jgi:GntR family transcriptional regulator
VRDHQAAEALSRFNPMRAADGAPLRGDVKSRKVKLASPTNGERAVLRLGAGDQVVRIQRIRVHEQRPFAYEMACLPDRRFPRLAEQEDIPDELEGLAQACGVLVARAEAKVRVTPAPAAAAAALALPERTAVLMLERVAFDTDDEPIETMVGYYDLREEYCRLDMR